MFKEVLHLTLAILMALILKNIIKSFVPTTYQTYLA